MKLCMGCMEQIGDENTICPYCGYEENSMPQESFHLVPGTKLNKRYIVGKVLGFGGFGITYIGYDTTLEKKLAIKEYFPSEFATRTMNQKKVTVYTGEKADQYNLGLNKFVDEARKLAKFNDDNEIVNVYDAIFENETAYILMEYLEGESLKQMLDRKRKLTLEETEKIILPIFESLKSVHEAGIIHRNISPDNIFITNAGKTKLLDFGAARYASATHSRSLTVMYQPGYAPEEQYRSRGEQGSWTDIYALAATMYKCLTGMTPQTSLERRIKDTIKPPKKLGVKMPKNKEIALMNALNIEIVSRTKSSEMFLQEWNSNQKVNRIVERFAKSDIGKVGRKTKLIMTAGILALLGVGGYTLLQGGVRKVIDEITLADGMVRVPSVINESVSQANEITNAVGIRLLQSDTKYDDEIEIGKVLSQSVDAGQAMNIADDLLVVVSGGSRMIVMPEIVGLSQERAVERLESLGFQHKIKTEYSAIAEGTVLMADCEVGEPYERGKTVTLYVSCGLNQTAIGTVSEYTVREYAGMSVEDLSKELQFYGIYLNISEYKDSDEIDDNHILSQMTAKGTKLQSGDTLNVIVSRGNSTVYVGQVLGWQFESKKKELEEMGYDFVMEIGEEVYDDSTAPGVILSVKADSDRAEIKRVYVNTEEPTEMYLPRGTKLTCTVSKGPDPQKELEKSGIAIGNTITFGKYEQDNNLKNGEEAIEWIVLDIKDKKCLLISKYALENKKYHNSYEEITWENCTLRQWLNGTFYKSAFSSEERERILTTEVKADKNPDYGTSGGNNTEDKVFLLSYTEAEKYFNPETNKLHNLLSAKPTEYLKAKPNVIISEGETLWFLRTPGETRKNVMDVDVQNHIGYGYRVDNADYSVRPAIWVEIQ